MNVLDAYNEWRTAVLFFSKGIRPKRSTSVDAIKTEHKIFFEKFVQLIENNDGLIDWKLMVNSLAKFYNGWYHPKLLVSLKGMKIYKTNIKLANCSDDSSVIYSHVVESLKFVKSYCNEKNIDDFDSYLNENKTFIPTMLKHYSSGSISPYFLAMIPNIILIMNNFPKDSADEFAADFISEYSIYRSKIVRIKKLNNCINNFYQCMNAIIKKQQGEKQKTN